MMSLIADNDEDKDVSLDELRRRLANTRQRRQTIATLRRACKNHTDEIVVPRLNQLRLARQEAIEEYQSFVMKRQGLAQYLGLASRWNVLNDCFPIWHVGPWATISGTRLGGTSPRLPPGLSSHVPPSSHPQAQRRSLLWSSVAPSQNPATKTALDEPPKVSWLEINASLGHVVMLLSLLVDRCGWSVTHELVPLASASQIGIRRPVKSLFGTSSQLQPPQFHNLYFDESRFALFKGGAMRQFQLGLVALLECFHEISDQLTDKTIAMPHAIELADDRTSATIGGLPMTFGETNDFTRACKYMLTNLKWLVAYAVKHHVDR